MTDISLDTMYRLDGGKTKRILECIPEMFPGAWEDNRFDPYTPNTWRVNPINAILQRPDVMERLECSGVEKLTGKGLFRSQILCQQIIWRSAIRKGPEGDSQAKTLRKLWYAGHKAAAQEISNLFECWRDGQQMDDTAANGAQSSIYGDFVDTGLITYLDMFVKDGSRSFEKFSDYQVLPAPLNNIVIAIEKDAAYEDCVAIGRALGVRVAMSGGGKMGKAGTERMVREALSSYFEIEEPGDLVTADNPLYVMVISDYDYDGEAVIAPTFVEQMTRYVDPKFIKWIRVGINPSQLVQMGHDVVGKAYRVKFQVNAAYTEWCRKKALFEKDGNVYQGLPKSLRAEAQKHNDLKALFDVYPPLGYELDALMRVEYAELVVEGFLSLVPWDDLLDALSRKAMPEEYEIVNRVREDTLRRNVDYQALQDHMTEAQERFDEIMAELRATSAQFSDDVNEAVKPLVEAWSDDDRILDRDPVAEQTEFVKHLQRTRARNHWQPYESSPRADRWVEVVEEEEEPTLGDWVGRDVPFTRVNI